MFGNGACPHDAGSVKTRGVTVRPARRGMQRPEPCGGERLRPSTGGFVASDRLGRARAFHVGPLPHGCSPEVRAVRGFSRIGHAGWRGPSGNGRPAVMRSPEVRNRTRPRRAINFGA